MCDGGRSSGGLNNADVVNSSAASEINPAPPMIMHIDLNSCFATIEQQSRPLLRHRPIAVVNRRTTNTAVVTASIEAKARGVKVGMKFRDAQLLCPGLIPLESDPPKYRYIYRKLAGILTDYSPVASMKSIDEGVIDLSQSPPDVRTKGALEIGREIKQRLRDEVGEYMRCNVGIGTNRWLAKIAAGIDKPDGLTEINASNLRATLTKLELEDLTGIAGGYSRRLRQVGILTPLDFLDADAATLEKIVFRGKLGRDWYKRLRGWEVDGDERPLKSAGRQFVIHQQNLPYEAVLQRFHALVEDTAAKLRAQFVRARGVRIYAKTYQHGRWQAHHYAQQAICDEMAIYEIVKRLTHDMPLPVYEIGVTCYGLTSEIEAQLSLLDDPAKRQQLTRAIDEINGFYGPHTIHSANTLNLTEHMSRKIPFGSVRYL